MSKKKPLKTGLFAEELKRLIANFDSKCSLKLFAFFLLKEYALSS